MKGIKLFKRFFLPLFFSIVLIFGGFFLAWAQDEEGTHDLEKIVVTATKTEVDESQVGSANTVVTARQIDEEGDADVYESLRGTPGISVSHSGGSGGLTDVYLWGSKPGHTLVMIDGVEVNDPMTTDRSFDFTHLPTDNIERVEVIRGPQSTLYGSDAMAGVINVITKKGKGAPKLEVFSEAGTHGTFHESSTFSGSKDKLDFSFSAGRFDSSGISSAKDGAERDRQQSSVDSSRIGYKISDNTNLDFVLHQTYSKTGLDDTTLSGWRTADDPNYTAWYRDLVTKVELDQSLEPWWEHKLSFSHFEAKRKYQDLPDSVDPTEDTESWYRGDNNKVEWQHNFSPVKWDTLTTGFEFNTERGSSESRDAIWGNSHMDRTSVDNKGYYIQNQFKLWESLFVTPAVRLDDHELFGKEVTYKVSSSYLVRKLGTRLKYNIGTGFKAPSLFQLFDPTYGDQNLNPDKSKSYDFGFEQDLFEHKASFGATYFYNNFKNMVDYDMTASKYKNIGRVKTKGIEFNSRIKPVAGLDIGLTYTYTKTRDGDTSLQLIRRSQDQAGMDINWLLLKKLNLNWKTVYVGHNWNDDANTVKVKQYSKSDISLSYSVSKNLKVFTRVENFLDRKYQEVRGYSTPGRSFYGGFKGEF
ncbi:MAG: TonB-dependent receptor [Candidatus Omnitrophica bacterium]|nr:TonB-dependent receptor [Candidatus Omnitrophota bacterium]